MPAGASDLDEDAQEFKRTVMATQERVIESNLIIFVCPEFSQAVEGLHGFSAENKKAIDTPHYSWQICQINDGFATSPTHRTRQVHHRQGDGTSHAPSCDGGAHAG